MRPAPSSVSFDRCLIRSQRLPGAGVTAEKIKVGISMFTDALQQKTGTLRPGMGVTAELLVKNGIRVYGESETEENCSCQAEETGV